MQPSKHVRSASVVWSLFVTTIAAPGALAFDNPYDDGHQRRCDPQDPPQPNTPCETPCDQCNATGSPVFLANGDMSLRFADLHVHGPMDLPIARFYHSRDDRSGLFGRGWTHSLETRAIPWSEGKLSGVVVRWEGGQRHRFIRQPDGTFSAPVGSPIKVQSQPGGGYRIVDERGVAHETDLDGDVIRRVDRNGNTAEFELDPSTQCIAAVETATGRTTIVRGANGRVASITDPAGRTVVYQYDALGNLTGVVDTIGNLTTYQYDGSNRLIRALDALGRITHSVSYDTQGRVTRLVDSDGDHTYAYAPGQTTKTNNANGGQWVYRFDARGVLRTLVDPLGGTTQKTYDSQYNLTAIVDPLGKQTTYTYDAIGNVLVRTDPGGLVTTHTYNAAGQIATLTAPDGVMETYDYDSNGNLLRVRQAAGTPLERELLRTYDSNGNLTSFTDGAEHTWMYTYDGTGHRTSATSPLGDAIHYTYDGAGNVLSALDTDGHGTTYEYDGANNLTKETDAEGASTTWEYADGWLVAETAPDGAITTYVRDQFGRITSKTDPGGGLWLYGHSADGRLLSMTDPLGQVFTYQYDISGHVIRETLSGVGLTSYEYDAVGNVTKRTDALGNASSYTYDHAGRLLTETDPLGRQVQHDYDAVGREVRTTQPDGSIYEFEYDELGRRALERDPLHFETTFHHDLADTLVAIAYPDGSSTAFENDSLGRVVRETVPTIGVVQYVYDGRNLTRVLDRNGKQWQLGYDRVGRLTSVVDPLGNRNSFTHDGTGRVTSWTNARQQQITYTYDANGSVVATAFPGGAQRTFGYDALGRLTSVVDAHTNQNLAYDSVDRLITVVDSKAGKTISYSYDAAGRRIGRQVTGHPNATYAYDAAGRLIQLQIDGTGVYFCSRDPNGRVTEVDRPGGMKSRWTYDLRGDVAQVQHVLQGGAILAQYDYARDSRRRLTGLTESNGNGATLAYDAASRLTSEIRTGTIAVNRAFTYDAAGNRLVLDADGVITQYNYDDAGRLTDASAPGAQSIYDYDADGNVVQVVTNGVVNQYGFDSESRLTSITSASGHVALGFSAFGQLASMESAGSTVRFLSEGDWLLSRLAGDGSLEALWNRADGVLLSVFMSAASWELFQDLTDSVRIQSTALGNVVNSYDYDAFGGIAAVSETVPNPIRFAGRPTQGTFSLFLDGPYDTRVGRFASRGSPEGPVYSRPYAFAGNDPLRRYLDRTEGSSGGVLPLDHSTDNTIICDGKGDYVVHIGNAHPYGVKDCTQKHEEQHVRDWKKRWPNGCKKADGTNQPYGYLPTGGDGYDAFLKDSECAAWKIGLTCNEENAKECCTDYPKQTNECEEFTKGWVDWAKKQVKKYCN